MATNRSIPLESLCTLHLSALRAAQAAPDTLDGYGRVERAFIAHVQERLGEPPTLAALTVANGRRYADRLVGRGLSPNTVRHYLTILRIWAGFLEREEGLLRGNPLAGLALPRATRTEIVPFTPEEIGRMVALAHETRAPLRNRALLMLAVETGLRAAELVSLTPDDLEYATEHAPGRAKVLGKGRKERLVYFGGKCSAAINRYVLLERPKRARARALFLGQSDGPLAPESVGNVVKSLARLAGIEGKRCTAHDLRHTFATQYARENPGQIFQLQALLGHSTLEQSRHYARLASLDVQGNYASLLDGWKHVHAQAAPRRERDRRAS